MAYERNRGLTSDPLFVGLTRPPMIAGVTYSALIVNVVVTVETFILTGNLVWLLTFLPLHGIFYLLCLVEPRFVDLVLLWCRTRGPAFVGGNLRLWKANSYSPLALDLPRANGLRSRIADVTL